MSTRFSTDIAADHDERTQLTATYDMHGQGEADLTIYTLGEITGPAMSVGLHREDAQKLIDWLTDRLSLIPPRPSNIAEYTLPSGRDASRAATDLRNRGFKVSGDLTGRTILVETPAGWTGTPAADVVRAHQ